MNYFQKISRKIIKASFDASVSTIEFFSSMDRYHKQVDELRKLENGTLGREIATCLDHHNLNLVPRYESHDLKHVLLNFKMTAEDEIRMQAFMIGNGNYSVPSFAIFFFGAILLPDLWPTFYGDFKKGRNTISISEWTIENYASQPIDLLRMVLEQPKPKKRNLKDMKRFTQFAAIAIIVAGIVGMLICLPFLFSSNLADLIGAGSPFVGGTILVVGGLITLSNLSNGTDKSERVAVAAFQTD